MNSHQMKIPVVQLVFPFEASPPSRHRKKAMRLRVRVALHIRVRELVSHPVVQAIASLEGPSGQLLPFQRVLYDLLQIFAAVRFHDDEAFTESGFVLVDHGTFRVA